jgi:2'-5' RNA ligase
VPDPLRLFVALEVPEAVKEAVQRKITVEQQHLPPTRWVRPQGLHLTLAFLGETAAPRLPDLQGALVASFAASRPFTVAIQGAGTFPPQRPARVAWLGVEGEAAEVSTLMGLQRRVAKAAFAVVGKEPERRPFHPHLTLGRPRAPWPQRAVERFTTAFGAAYGEPFPVRQGALIRSHLDPGGARYETLGEYPLGTAGKGDP